MEMSTFHAAWIAAQAEHDQAMLVLTLIALAVATLWLLIERLPSSWRNLARVGCIAQVMVLIIIAGGAA